MTADSSKDLPRATAEFIAGMQNIEREIMNSVRAAGGPLTADFVIWNRGKHFLPPPESISLEIKFHGRSANGIFSRAQIEDSHSKIDRPDVAKMIADLAQRLK